MGGARALRGQARRPRTDHEDIDLELVALYFFGVQGGSANFAHALFGGSRRPRRGREDSSVGGATP